MTDEHVWAIPDGGAESITFAAKDRDDGPSGVDCERERRACHLAVERNQEFLVEVARRAPVLQALRAGPASGAELATTVDMSRSTVHRATTSLEEQNLVTKSSGDYELTRLGALIADKVGAFGAEVSTALAMEPFLNTIDTDGVPTGYFTEARITRPEPRQPHKSIHRIIELIEGSDSLQMLSTVLSPIYVDVGYREMKAGMEIEAVFDQEAIDIMISEYAEQAHETIRQGNFTVYSHQGLPFELFILDDRMGMAAHDENGVARLLVECDAAEAIEWAETVYADHQSEAVPLLPSKL